MKFTQRITSRTRKRKESRKIRGVLELLETRKLMAGDLNMGSYVIGGSEPEIDAPSVIESVEETTPMEAPGDSPASPAASNVSEPGGIDAALTGDQSWLPPGFLPCCPAVKLDDAAAEATLTDGDGSEANINDPAKPMATFQVHGNPSGLQGPRNRIALSLRTASEHRGALPLTSSGSQAEHLLGISERNDAASTDQTASDEFHYFAAEGNRHLSGGPSLVKESLSGHVQSDTFMAMSLLPSPGSSEPHDNSASPHEPATQSYRQHSVQSEHRSDELDLSSLRDAASAAESAQIVAPLPFLATSTDSLSESLSAAVASVVSIDCWSGGTGTVTDDACLIAKLNENRFQFAAFAFVFTVVTVRMNSKESEQQDTEMETQQESSQVPG